MTEEAYWGQYRADHNLSIYDDISDDIKAAYRAGYGSGLFDAEPDYPDLSERMNVAEHDLYEAELEIARLEDEAHHLRWQISQLEEEYEN